MSAPLGQRPFVVYPHYLGRRLEAPAENYKLAGLCRRYESLGPLTLERAIDRSLAAMPIPVEEPLSA